MSLTLRRLTAMEESKLNSEHSELSQQILGLEKLMSEDKSVFECIKQETQELRDKHAVPRRSVLLGEEQELEDTDLLANERQDF